MKTTNTEEMVQIYTQTREVDLRDAIVLQLAGLVESIARRFLGSGEPFEDLAQEGYLGLLNALDLYNPDKGVKFTTYATHLIIGQIKHYLRDKGKIIKEPAWLQELNHKINRVVHELTLHHSRPPTTEEVARLLGMSTRAVEDVLTTREIFKVSSLDAVVEDDEGEWGGYDLDKVQQEGESAFHLPIEERMVLEKAVMQLKDLEQRVLQLFFYEGYNQTEIAHQMSISCNYVSHILRNATQKLRRILTEEEWRDQQKQQWQALQRGDFEAQIIDAQTGLYSQAYLRARVEEETQRSSRTGDKIGLALFELQGMNHFVKTFGELTLGELLAQMAGEARGVMRKADIVARYGTYMLGILMPYSGDHTPEIAERVSTQLSEWLKGMFAQYAEPPALLAGWSTYPNEASNGEELFKSALQRLRIEGAQYRQKAA